MQSWVDLLSQDFAPQVAKEHRCLQDLKTQYLSFLESFHSKLDLVSSSIVDLEDKNLNKYHFGSSVELLKEIWEHNREEVKKNESWLKTLIERRKQAKSLVHDISSRLKELKIRLSKPINEYLDWLVLNKDVKNSTEKDWERNILESQLREQEKALSALWEQTAVLAQEARDQVSTLS